MPDEKPVALPARPPSVTTEEDEALNMEYSDSLLLDLFHLDTKHFFTRYKVDFWGLMLSSRAGARSHLRHHAHCSHRFLMRRANSTGDGTTWKKA